MKRMKRMERRSLRPALIFAVVSLAMLAMTSLSFAADSPQYREACFLQPGQTGCGHLMQLSMAVSEVSRADPGSGEEGDRWKSIRTMMTQIGFTKLEVNGYYSGDGQTDSVGCLAGCRTINDGDKEYTLLAIVPCSREYGGQWAGNFQVGKGPVHEGFLAGRDEVLRFVRQYVEKQGIRGQIKVWIPGHSRGAAIANLLGAFFAAGGGSYLGDVSLAAEDIYCYGFAVPGTVIEGRVTKADLLSVAGAESKTDTPGEAYIYRESDAGELLEPAASAFACIHNVVPDYDAVTSLPPAKWGYTRFGSETAINDGTKAMKKRMLEVLKEHDSACYQLYAEGADQENFRAKTFDPQTLRIIDDPKDPSLTQAEMISERIGGLTGIATSSEIYEDQGFEEPAAALAGLVGMNYMAFFDGAKQDIPAAVRAGGCAYLAYASERLQAEGKAENEGEAVALALVGLVEFFSGSRIDHNTVTADQMIAKLSAFLLNTMNVKFGKNNYGVRTVKSLEFKSEEAEKAFTWMSGKLLDLIPEGSRNYFYLLVGISSDMTEKEKIRKINEFLAIELSDCAKGDTETLYTMLNLLPLDSPVREIIGQTMNKYGDPVIDGHNSSVEVADGLLKMILREEKDGTEIVYEDLDDAADAALRVLIAKGADAVKNSGEYDDEGLRRIEACSQSAQKGIRQLRRFLLYGVMYSDSQEFSTEDNVRNITTLYSQGKCFLTAHMPGTYYSWVQAMRTREHTNVSDSYAPLCLKSIKQKKTSVKLTWKKTGGAVKYVVYGDQAGGKGELALLAECAGTDYNVKKIDSGLKKGTYYRFQVDAFDREGKIIARSKLIYVATSGGKAANYKKITVKVKQGGKTKKIGRLTLKEGSEVTLKASASPSAKVKKYAGIGFESSDPSVAAVSSKGRLQALSAGTCKVYAYGQNGIARAITVVVK